MRKTISIIAVTGALALGATPALANDEHCEVGYETVSFIVDPGTPGSPAIPAVPPVYETVTEYEFVHRRAEAVRWERNPNWNAESNPQSFGWAATGNTREVTTDVVLAPGHPEVPAVDPVPETWETFEQEILVCTPVIHPMPGEDTAPLPQPVEEVVEDPAPAPETAVRTAAEAPAAAPAVPSSAHPEELAYTGAADWVFPTGLGLLGAGAGLVALRRKLGAA